MTQAARLIMKDLLVAWKLLELSASLGKHGARYINYGDGDSKSYDEVKKNYPGMTMEKYECIGHCQATAFANFVHVLKV